MGLNAAAVVEAEDAAVADAVVSAVASVAAAVAVQVWRYCGPFADILDWFGRREIWCLARSGDSRTVVLE